MTTRPDHFWRREFQKLAGRCHSNDKALTVEADVDRATVWFGPNAPDGQEANWVQTIPGKGIFLVEIRLYGPLEPWFDKSCQGIGDLEPVAE